MAHIKTFLRKVKKKYKDFKKNECGGDIVNQVLLLAIALLIIGLLLAFAMTELLKAKEGFKELITEWGSMSQDSQFETETPAFIQDNVKANRDHSLDKDLSDILYIKEILTLNSYLDSFNFIKSTN